jgi:hypothetical protein
VSRGLPSWLTHTFALFLTSIELFAVLSILNYRFEQRIGTAGIVGSSPLLTIGYASVTIVHQIVALWRESFGRPIGLWGLRSKIVWVCGDLFFIALW